MPLTLRLCLGITGHRRDNPEFLANQPGIVAALTAVFDALDEALAVTPVPAGATLAAPRLHSLLADGTDQIAAEAALARGWELAATLPFGQALNEAIGARPDTAAEADVLLQGDPTQFHTLGAEVRERAIRIRHLAARARVFELADRDAPITELLFAKFTELAGGRAGQLVDAEVGVRVALACRVMIEQIDLLIAVWDGRSRSLQGGTGHTIQAALDAGAAVLWIGTDAPGQWRILKGPDALVDLQVHTGAETEDERLAQLQELVKASLQPALPRAAPTQQHAGAGLATPAALEQERWRPRSNPAWHLYRRVEALFGETDWKRRLRNLRQQYESPDAVTCGTAAQPAAAARALPGQDMQFVATLEASVFRRFAWADGVASHLSDVYRGGMTASFLLGALAIVGGVAYLPFAPDDKWIFALFEMLVLAAIVAFTLTGRRRSWHGRWFETRRVAEYLRHAPILQVLGVARPPGRWPVGMHTAWPEWYARHLLRDAGLPRLVVTPAFLRGAVEGLLHRHVRTQREYHLAKARRLQAVHHNLDRWSEVLFSLAVVSVGTYLLLKGGGAAGWWPAAAASASAKHFTFLGVALPTFGGAIAGIRYFGDFERFAAISGVTSGKLEALQARCEALLKAPEGQLEYARVSELAHEMDEIVVSEIEAWQAVFGGKNVTVPV